MSSFVDELTLHLKAGKGGNGVVRWLHVKGKDLSGPAGGDGGRGGNVYARGIRDITALERYMHDKKYNAENGGSGSGRSKEGKNGDDFILDVPVGSVLINMETDEEFEILTEGEQVMILKGGSGGRGNEHFKGSENRSPEQSTDGKSGEEADFHIELKLVVDAGLIGLPNAGKSSLLNAITGAHAKVGNYEFTTLNPNLGVLYGFILADIPGLIEGASEGRGLGHKFLRHVTRTKMIIHCVSAENEDVAVAYRTVRDELDRYSHELSSKPELILITKADLLTPEELDAKKEALARAADNQTDFLSVSIYDDQSLKVFSDALAKRFGGEAKS